MGIQEFDFATGKVLSSGRKQALVLSKCIPSCELIENRLRDRRYKFLGVSSDLRHALEMVRKFKEGVLFLDADIEGVEALPLMEVLTKKAPSFKVILMTQSPTKELLSDGQTLGAVGFLVKPLSAEAVEKAIDRVK